MELVRKIFDCVLVLKRKERTDMRGSMTVVYEDISGFEVKETRIYEMPKAGTFIGIHYRDVSDPMTKLVTVIRGRGMDYVIDLREDSPTYLKWEKLELNAKDCLAVLIPAGIGHAFLSLEDDTVQVYSVDACGSGARSKQLNYLDPKIGLALDGEVRFISDYDRGAPFLS